MDRKRKKYQEYQEALQELWRRREEELQRSGRRFAVLGLGPPSPDPTTQVTDLSLTKDEKTEMELVEKHITEQGSLNLRVVHSIFYGPPAVGKTCTRKRLTGSITNLRTEHPLPSTGIEKPCTVNLFHKTEQCSVLLSQSLEEWEEQDIEAQCQTLLDYIMHSSQVHSYQTTHQSVEKPWQDLALLESPEAECFTTTTDFSPDPTLAADIPTGSSDLPLPRPPPQINVPKDSALRDFIQNVTATKKWKEARGDALKYFIQNVTATKKWKEVREGLKAIEHITILHITDTGGQPEFHDILPLLLQGPAIFLLFLNLTRDLDEHCEIAYRWKDERRRSVVYKSQFTIKEMLFQLLVSVASHSADKLNAAVMFIGTYLDCVGTEGLSRREEELKELIQSTELFKKDVVKTFPQDGSNSLIFPLDNIDGLFDEVKKLRDSIAFVIEGAFDRVSLPTSWLLFHLVLRSEYEAKPGYCTLEECKEVAKSCGIEGDIVVDILTFMHKRFGTILYYSEVPSLTDVVICDPNVIFMRATKLVTLSFGANPNRPNASKEIRKFGEIDISLMEEETKKEKSPFFMNHVVDLLTHYNIISQIKKSDGSLIYFMPCLLLPDPTVGQEKDLSHINPAPLLIMFSTGYVPLGLFSALIVHLSKLDDWEIDTEECRYKNKMQFVVDKCTCTRLVLMSHVDRLELRVQSPKSSIFAVICHDVVRTINEALKILKSRHKYMKFNNSLGFYCPSGLKVKSAAPHAAVCMETVSPEYMECQCKPKCVTTCSILQEEHKVWFQKLKQNSIVSASAKATELVPVEPPFFCAKAKDNDTTADPLTLLHFLENVATRIPAKWRKVGLALNIPTGSLDGFEERYRGDQERCYEAIFEAWQNQPTPPTWGSLLKALRTKLVNESHLADELLQQFSRHT